MRLIMCKPLNLFILLIFVNIFALQAQCSFEAQFINNYDGDTFYAYVEYPANSKRYDFVRKKVKCRLYQCDTYELNSKNENEKQLAIAAKYFTNAKLSKGKFRITYIGKDFFGRWLVMVHLEDGTSLKDLLEKKGYLTNRFLNYNHKKKIKPHVSDY